MADEEAIRRLKMAEETIENLQKNLAATKQVGILGLKSCPREEFPAWF
jgi:hypothetical protein